MASLWDLLTQGFSDPEAQTQGRLMTAGAPGGVGLLSVPQPQQSQRPAGLFGALGSNPFGALAPSMSGPNMPTGNNALGTALAPFSPVDTGAGTMTPKGYAALPGNVQPSFQQGNGINTMGTTVRDTSNAVADAQGAGMPSFTGLPMQSRHAALSNTPSDLLLGQQPQGLAAIKPAGAAADMPAASAMPAMGQGAPGAGGTAIGVPGYDGAFTRAQADDGDGRPSQREWDAAAAARNNSGGPVASGLTLGAGLAAKSGLPASGALPGGEATAGTATPQPSFFDGLKKGLSNIYGNGGPGDALITLGVGMMSGPGGLQRALQMQQQAGQNRSSQALQNLQMQMQLAKQQQDQQAQAGAVGYIKSAYKQQGQDISDDQARAIAANSGALSTIVSGTFKDKAASPQLVDVPMGDGTTQKQWITPGSAAGTPVGATAQKAPPDAVRDLQYARQNWQANGLPDPNNPTNAGFWQDFAQKRLGGGGGVSVTLPGAEKASDAAFGQAEGKHFGDILSAGDTARQTQGQLALMNDAFQQGGSNISTGPFAKSILAGKQAIQGLTGIDLGGVPESEAVNKLGFGLATSLTKEISQRPAQAEFLKSLQNVPGLLMSQPGSRVMMSILNQQAQQKVDLGQLVQDPNNRKSWGQVEQQYFDTHPLVSPFTGKPLNKNDLSDLRAAAQRENIDPSTGQTGGGSASSAPLVPSWSVVGD